MAVKIDGEEYSASSTTTMSMIVLRGARSDEEYEFKFGINGCTLFPSTPSLSKKWFRSANCAVDHDESHICIHDPLQMYSPDGVVVELSGCVRIIWEPRAI